MIKKKPFTKNVSLVKGFFFQTKKLVKSIFYFLFGMTFVSNLFNETGACFLLFVVALAYFFGSGSNDMASACFTLPCIA